MNQTDPTFTTTPVPATGADMELTGHHEPTLSGTPSATAPVMPPARVMQPGRALVGWLPDAQALALMLGHAVQPGEDTSALQVRLQQHRDALAHRAAHQHVDAVRDELVTDDLRAVATRPELQAAFGQAHWTITMVDLASVIAYQPMVNTGSLDERIAPVLADRSQLLEFCLPSNQAQALETISDVQSITVVSANPNLQMVGTAMRNELVQVQPGAPPMNLTALICYAYLGQSYLHVVHYRDRYFLRDGYHRAAALVRADITMAPCILTDARRYEEVVSLPNMIAEDLLLGDRPPSIADYWSDDVACEVHTPVVKTVLRVRPDRFAT